MNRDFLRSRRFIFLATVFVILGLVLIFRSWSKSPSYAVIVPPIIEEPDVRGSAIELEEFETQLFSTNITSNLRVRNKNEVSTQSILGQYLLTYKDSQTDGQVAVTIGLVKENSVDEVSAVQFRRLETEGYTELESDPIFPEGNVVFIRESNFEKAVYWAENGRYVGVVVSGGVQNRSQLENSQNVVITNWQWR